MAIISFLQLVSNYKNPFNNIEKWGFINFVTNKQKIFKEHCNSNESLWN